MKPRTPASTVLAAKQIGENLATWRKLMGFTAAQVADRAGISRSTLSRLEKGDPAVSLATFLNVCRAVQMPYDGVVSATDPYETDLGRIRSDWKLPQRVRKAK